ncbi:MAG: hypothetical protein HOI35_01920 [Woeseia sp.]|jgi:hypothetical protein|nr:hypothetical protein [Woeseia sp.]MBT6208765.1 hypothetical protein [Woeseia sp.]
MSTDAASLRQTSTRELALFLVLFLVGVAVLPFSVYLVGHSVFGEYGGSGFSAFFADLHASLRGGDLAIWFLVLSPYVGWQTLRLTYHAFRGLGQSQ